MAQPPICAFGEKATGFSLPATDGKIYGLDELKGPKGLVLVFMCNHCPYVKSILDRLVSEALELQKAGIGFAGICANDAASYPEDSFDKMKLLADKKAFPFPYLHDEKQEVAKAYGAVCTPDFFGYNGALELNYRGRLDASKTTLVEGARRDLFLAMKEIAESGHGPSDQIPSMGCSIKWKSV